MRVAGMMALLLVSLAARAEIQGGTTRRFAICVGSDDGGRDRQRLRYATSDAQGVCRLFTDMGGVAAEDSLLLLNPSRAQIEGAFAQVAQRTRDHEAGAGVELVFYYSGHSSDEGLLLGKEKFPFPELRGAFESVPVQVRIAILDSCLSGSFTRLKGGKTVAPFLVDVSSSVHGRAVLTSSSATEASQESDRLHGSFFTHYLLSGLRGAADASHDGRVTLNEAYHFAFEETLARTQNTKAGAQHPSYEMDLAGTGDVVMTELHPVSAKLVLGTELEGRIFIRDQLQQLLLEVRKGRDEKVTLGVPAGAYEVTMEQKEATYAAHVEVPKDQEVGLPASSFQKQERELTASRGGNAESEMDDAPRGEVPSALARGELILFQTLHGVAQGALFCSAVPCSDTRPVVASITAGAMLGAGTAFLATRHGITPGQTLAVNVGTQWGLANGLLLNAAFFQNDAVAAAMFGMASGTLVGGSVAYYVKPRAGQVAVADSVGLWSGGLTSLMLAGFGESDDRVTAGLTIALSDLGLASGMFLARNVDVSRGHVVLINVGGVLGGLLGVASVALAEPHDNGRALAFGAAIGAGAGLGAAAYATRNLDAKTGSSVVMLPMSGGHPGLSLAARW